MDGKALLLQMIDFDRWASSRLRETIAQLESAIPKAVTLQAHIYRGWEAWINRIEKVENQIEWFPMLSLDEAEKIRRDEEGRWDSFLAAQTDDWTEQTYVVKTLDGKVGEFSLTEIILQLVTHGAHHRGQINTLIRGAGGSPVNPLFVGYVVANRS